MTPTREQMVELRDNLARRIADAKAALVEVDAIIALEPFADGEDST